MTLESMEWFLFGGTWVLVLALAAALWRLKRRLDRQIETQRRLLQDVNAEDLFRVLQRHVAATREAQDAVEKTRVRADQLAKQLDGALQHVGLVRFNPFEDTGGHLSFALAVTDGAGNGYVLCNLHGRRESRLYAKPVETWESTYPLSEEEQQALECAKANGAIQADET